MSEFVEQLRALIGAGDVRVSEHGYDGLAEDGLTAREVIHGVLDAVLVEEYANYRLYPDLPTNKTRRFPSLIVFSALPHKVWVVGVANRGF